KRLTEWLSFVLFQMIVMIEEQNAVARRNPKNSQETHKRTERDDTITSIGPKDSTNQGRRQSQKRERRQLPTAEAGVQQQKGARCSGNGCNQQASLSGLPFSGLAEKLRVILERKLELLDAGLNVSRHRAEVAPPDVGVNVDASRGIFPADDVRCR